MATNLKVGKTSDALAHLTTPLAPQNPFAPWGVSPQAKRLLSLFLFLLAYRPAEVADKLADREVLAVRVYQRLGLV